MTYAQKYYAKLKAGELGITVEEYLAMKGGSVGAMKVVEKKVISFDKVQNLSSLDVNSKMLQSFKSGLVIDSFLSHDGGFPVASSMMISGVPGSGKTTIALHTMAHMQKNNPKLKCLFISAEMGRVQLFKYMQRFPIFSCVKTLIAADFINDNMKDVVEGLLDEGFDFILIDSIAELLESVRGESNMSLKEAEKWLIDLCMKHNEGKNKTESFSSFILIQQVTKGGVFVGNQKVKHLVDSHLELKRESMKDGGGLFMIFTKNRNGQTDTKWSYQLTSNDIHYGYLVDETEEEEAPKQFEITVDRETAVLN